jgi:Domain of unknown function (DUF4296)
MNRIFSALIGLSLLVACQAGNDPDRIRPAKLLTPGQVTSILTDITLAESVVTMSGLSFQDALSRYDLYERDILRKNGVDSTTYRQSYRYYMSRSEDMEAIFTALNDSLAKRRDAHTKLLDIKGIR